jgi:hypothetical protein
MSVDSRLNAIRIAFADSHLIRHNNNRELRVLIDTEGFPALFARLSAVRDMFAA